MTVWTREHLELLGTMPDRELSEIVGVSLTSVFLQRRKRGIKPVVRSGTAEFIRRHPFLTQVEIADILKISRQAISSTMKRYNLVCRVREKKQLVRVTRLFGRAVVRKWLNEAGYLYCPRCQKVEARKPGERHNRCSECERARKKSYSKSQKGKEGKCRG